MISNKTKLTVILGGLFLAGLIGGAPAHAEDAATSTSGTNFSAWARVTAECAEPSKDTINWKVETGQEGIAYEWNAYGDSSGIDQRGKGILPGSSTTNITVKRTGVLGKTSMNVRWGKEWYPYNLVNQYAGGEDRSCFPENQPAPAPATQAPAAPAEDPQTISLMETIVGLLKQIIALRLAR